MTAGRVSTFSRSGLTFDVRDEGPLDGPTVVLLHGFPQDSSSWDKLAPLLHARGFRTVAPDQRGYSPGARPRARRAYRGSELAADVAALIDELEVGKVDLVGHDWGAAVAWQVAAKHSDKLRTLTTLSVPHPIAFLGSMLRSTQGLKSWYMIAFQVPFLPEWALSSTGVGEKLLISSGQSPANVRRDLAAMRAPGRLRGGVNWYRAMWMSVPGNARITVPTLHVWSDGDTALGPKGAALTPKYVDGPYRFEVLPGVSHWIPDEAPEAVDRLLGEHLTP
ncbi:pimeloyl-ACP methyl ester carboxylesterase [Rhodococcus sp. 27YEA15]|uniref:alpha/beta fold hydrolase n=1 Tax=Rhodococcus sp. 27YEA15 TaxID=3156259 RepID=UPI003C7C09D1